MLWTKKLALDKTNNRIPENTLHVLAVIGGWAGALVARFLFRHKTQKQPFVQIFWVTVALNVSITVYLIISGSMNDRRLKKYGRSITGACANKDNGDSNFASPFFIQLIN